MKGEPPIISGVSKSKNYFPWIALIVVLCIPVFFVGSFLAMPLITIYRADEGFKKAKKTIKSEDLRAWALEEIKNLSGTNGFSTKVPQSEIPDYIKNLYSIPPEGAWVNPKTSESAACVMIVWGGGFFHWGFDIGSTNFMSSTNPEYPKAFMWCAGIYYRREAAWGLL